LRLLHFLAIAVLAAWLVPRDWRTLKTPVMRCAIRCGQNSLPIYCLGVLLAFASHMVLLDISNGLAMQIALSVGGIMAMVVSATLLNLISIKPRKQPARNNSLLSEHQANNNNDVSNRSLMVSDPGHERRFDPALVLSTLCGWEPTR
jgi:hypothetical protein